jgi:DNA topoisomerase-6 subunit B
LAVITPYAELSLTYLDSRTDALTRESGTKNNKPLSMVFTRRSDRIPPIPEEVKHHPKSVNNLIVRQLLDHVKHNTKLTTFFKTQFQCISGPMSKKLVEQLELDPKTATCRSLSDAEVYAITQVLQNERFPDPSGKCLSPAGEYNLRLGIMKDFGLESNYVATATMTKAGAFEGHPFTVECGLSFGGDKCKEGITVHRFANRIPLLFEAGSDVASKVAKDDVKWNNYKLKSKVDKLGIFVSICSTKIPFKGTGKEFISAQNVIYLKAIKK